jgi:hypothetical protein
MRRAIAVLALLVLGAVFFAVTVLAQAPGVTRINGIGFVDYGSPPTFKVGDYVRYHVSGQSALGMRDDYDLTILIAGEELFWGDSCFWLETWTEPRNGPPQAISTLMSYRVFADSTPIRHLQVYQRKQVNEIDQNGKPIEVLMEPSSSILKTRNLFQGGAAWDVDTLGRDTVITPVGEFETRKVSIRMGNSTTRAFGDSSRYDEARENRMVWHTLQVPITHVARESLENVMSRRTWMLGRSEEGSPLLLRDRGLGSARLIAVGHDGQPRITPKGRRMSGTTAAQAADRPGGSKRR